MKSVLRWYNLCKISGICWLLLWLMYTSGKMFVSDDIYYSHYIFLIVEMGQIGAGLLAKFSFVFATILLLEGATNEWTKEQELENKKFDFEKTKPE